jgi:hypothetical protein
LHDSVEYAGDILEQILIQQDSIQSESFWILWEILEEQSRQDVQKRYVSYLLLSHRWWASKTDNWKPLEHKYAVMRRVVNEFGEYDIESVLRLLSGIGTEVLMPDGLKWLSNVLLKFDDPQKELTDSDVFFYAEKLIQRTYYRHLRIIKQDNQLRESFLHLLDLMLDAGSSLAFVVRERLIVT